MERPGRELSPEQDAAARCPAAQLCPTGQAGLLQSWLLLWILSTSRLFVPYPSGFIAGSLRSCSKGVPNTLCPQKSENSCAVHLASSCRDSLAGGGHSALYENSFLQEVEHSSSPKLMLLREDKSLEEVKSSLCRLTS